MALKDFNMKGGPAAKADPLEGLDDSELLTLRHRLDKKLNLDLTQLNLAEELGMQYRSGQILLASVQDDKDTPANQKAQVFNSVGAALEKIVKQQRVVYDAERLKRFESAFLKTLDLYGTDEQKRRFFDLYGEYLRADEKPAAPPAIEDAS
jgi:hypothetical protein